MKRKRHTPDQITRKLRDGDAKLGRGATIAESRTNTGESEATFQRWRAQYGGTKADETRRLRELARENARLKKLVAEQALDISILKQAAEGHSEPGAQASGRRVCEAGFRTFLSVGRVGCWAAALKALPEEQGSPGSSADCPHEGVAPPAASIRIPPDPVDASAKGLDTLAEARVPVEGYRLEYNHERPHSALGYRTPAEFAAFCPVRSVARTRAINLNTPISVTEPVDRFPRIDSPTL